MCLSMSVWEREYVCGNCTAIRLLFSFCFYFVLFWWKKLKAEANRPAVSSISRAESAETGLIHLPVLELANGVYGWEGRWFCRWGYLSLSLSLSFDLPLPFPFFLFFFSSCLVTHSVCLFMRSTDLRFNTGGSEWPFRQILPEWFGFGVGAFSAWFAQSNAISLLDGVFSIACLADSQSWNALHSIRYYRYKLIDSFSEQSFHNSWRLTCRHNLIGTSYSCIWTFITIDSVSVWYLFWSFNHG